MLCCSCGPGPQKPDVVRVAHRVRRHVPQAVLQRPAGDVHPALVRAARVQRVHEDLRAEQREAEIQSLNEAWGILNDHGN